MAQKVFMIGPVTFKVGEATAVSIPGIVSMDFGDGSDPNTFFGDGDVFSQFAWMENIVPRASIQTTDLSLLTDASFDPGDAGIIDMRFPQRASGAGGKDAGATALKCLSNAYSMLGTINPSASQAGQSSLNLPFTGISADGTTHPFTLSLSLVVDA